MTIREALAELERRFRELLEHEADCHRCASAGRYSIKSRGAHPRGWKPYVPPPRCISGLVRWRRWCRARDVLRAVERLRSRHVLEDAARYACVGRAPELPPMPAAVEPKTDLEKLERESEKLRKRLARRRWWRTR